MIDQTASLPAVRKRSLDWRALFLQLHLYLGLILGIPIVLMGLSGVILMLDRPAPGVGDPIPVARIAAVIDAARAVAPERARLISYIPAISGQPAAVRFARPRRGAAVDDASLDELPVGAATRIMVDPISLAATPEGSATGFMRFVLDLHSRMLIAQPQGRTIVGGLGAFMFAIGLTGIALWWPRPGQWRRALSFRFTRNGLRFSREFHGAVGIWGLAVFMMVSATGVYFAFPETLNDALGAGPALRANRSRLPLPVTPIEGERPIDVDRISALASHAVSNGVVRFVGFPANPRQAFRLLLTRKGEGKGAARITVYVDQWAGRVIEVRDPQTYPPLDRLLAWNGALHTGLGFGVVWWVLVFLTGLLPAALFVTGVTIWALKRRNRARVRAKAPLVTPERETVASVR